jgi:hypothetical protein
MSDDVGSSPGTLVHPTRRALVIALVAALLLAGLLLLERSGPSPVQRLQSISPAQPAAASATGSGGQSSALAGTAASPSRLANATVSGGGVQSQITGTGTKLEATCTQFTGGTATSVSEVDYDTRGTTISKVTTPGQFDYWVTIPAGTTSVTITETTNYAPTTGDGFIELGSGSAVFDSSCNPVSATITGGGGTVTVTLSAPATGTDEIGVKFMTHSIIGSDPASTTPGPDYTYTFSDGASGSSQALTLNHV